jgi:hypothetical protein
MSPFSSTGEMVRRYIFESDSSSSILVIENTAIRQSRWLLALSPKELCTSVLQNDLLFFKYESKEKFQKSENNKYLR